MGTIHKGYRAWEEYRSRKGIKCRKGMAFRIAHSELLPRSFSYTESSGIITLFQFK